MGGVINDILYDYLLWQYELKHKNIQLDKEIIRFYRILDGFENKMPWLSTLFTTNRKVPF